MEKACGPMSRMQVEATATWKKGPAIGACVFFLLSPLAPYELKNLFMQGNPHHSAGEGRRERWYSRTLIAAARRKNLTRYLYWRRKKRNMGRRTGKRTP